MIPPYARTYIGGENDVRGFDFYGISPIAFIPSSAPVSVLDASGNPRYQKTLAADGTAVLQAVTQNIPIYQIITPGGDTQVVGNFEYRIPIFGPVTMAPFFDFGLNRILYPNQLRLNDSRIDQLNRDFPQAAFNNKVQIAPGTQNIRMSTGLEIQVLLPIVQAPFRVYYSLNPSRVNEFLQTPIVADRSYFPNNASFLNAIRQHGQAFPFFEKRGTFRFTIGRTF